MTEKKEKAIKLIIRILLYVIGIFFVAWGVGFAISSNLGVSPATSSSYLTSLALKIDINYTIIAIYSLCILLQLILLRSRFKWYNIFQLVFAILFGYMTDFTKKVLDGFCFPTYFGQLGMLVISMLLISFGITLYVKSSLVPMPMEGLALAIAKVQKRFKFHHTKIFVDCTSVLIAVIVSLAAFGKLVGVREGTVIIAVCVGQLIKYMQIPFEGFFAWLLSSKREEALSEPAEATEPDAESVQTNGAEQ